MQGTCVCWNAGGGNAQAAGAAAAGAVHATSAAGGGGHSHGLLQPGRHGAARPAGGVASRQLEPLDAPGVLSAAAHAAAAPRRHRLPPQLRAGARMCRLSHACNSSNCVCLLMELPQIRGN